MTLLFGYRTSTSGPTPTGSSTVAVAAPAAPAPAAPVPAAPAAPTTAPTAGTAAFTGTVAQTRWGPVQVRITVAAGKITAVDVVQYPSGNGKDREINAYALPVLTRNTLSAQSANIDMVSGATVTSDGYVRSLQSALDQAGIA